MNKIGYILSIFCLIAFSFAGDSGCTDLDACNYSESAIEEDGSCVFPEEYYDCNGNCINDSDQDLVCDEVEILGCTDPDACNYNENATEDDGSCVFPDEYYDCNGNCINDSDQDLVCDEVEILGCTNPNACNYDELATEDGDCVGAPGIIDDMSIITVDGQNSVEISWTQPCGLGFIFTYTLMGQIDDEEIIISVSSPHIIENLNWSTSYSLIIKTENNDGESSTPVEFTISPETVPNQIQDFVAEPGEAFVSLSWNSDEFSSFYSIYMDDEIYTTTASSNDTSLTISNLSANIDYIFYVTGTNSEGNEGEVSELITIQVLDIYPVTTINTVSGAGEVSFSWLTPEPYAGDSTYTFTIFDEMGDFIEENYDGITYVFDGLETDEAKCIMLNAIHQFGVSETSALICESSNIPPPLAVEWLLLDSGQGQVTLNWIPHPTSYHFNIYRNEILIIANELIPINQYIDYNLQANTQYDYIVVALNANGIEGDFHDSVPITVTPLPIVQDVEIEAGNGRVTLNWSPPIGNWSDSTQYAGFGYTYKVYNASGDSIKSTNLPFTHIPNLEQDTEYCFTITDMSLGGYGYSENSDTVCAIPNAPFGEAFEWSIQIIAELTDNDGNPIGFVDVDEFNLIGVDITATDGYDPELDLVEYPGGQGDRVSLFFPHPEWGNFIGDQLIEKYTQDIRADIDLSSSVINWNSQIESSTYGYPKLTFYFNNNAAENTVYLFYRDSNNIETFQKIEDGEQVNLAFLSPSVRDNMTIIVGNAIPEPPINLSGLGGYREATIHWEDPCCQTGLQQYPAEAFNIWRNGELVGENIIGNSFTDRGLNYSTYYTYEVSGVNIAGEGGKSIEFIGLNTLENRAPVSKAGMDIIVYDLLDDNDESTQIILPVYSDFTNINNSFDPDNSYEIDGVIFLYDPPLDELNYSWTSVADSEYNDAELNIIIEGYGEKAFQLEVEDDGSALSSIDSVYVSYRQAPKPALVDSININSDLYYIELHWIESSFTGESYADLNNNGIWDAKEYFIDCGFDGLCPGDTTYTYPDEGEASGTWEFEDLNGNGWLDFDDLNDSPIKFHTYKLSYDSLISREK